MTIEARWQEILIAESSKTVLVEGNHYFPPGDVAFELLERSAHSTHCIWKGDANYLSISVNGVQNLDAAWYYAAPYPAAAEIEGYVAFWKGVAVSGENPDEPEILPPRPA